MAVSPLISATQAILNPLIPLASEQIRLAWYWKKELTSLQNRLEIIQALLRDAAQSPRVPMETLEVWLEKLMPVVRKAEDVLDEIAYERLRKKKEKFQVRDLISFSNSNPLKPFRLMMANKVKDITLELDDISKAANSIGFQPSALVANAMVEPPLVNLTLPFVDDSEIVGRGGDVLRVKEMVLEDSDVNDGLSVISIVGMAGLGKTALAQLVYKDDKVVNNFGDRRMWVCVSDNFEVKGILNEMVQILTKRESNLSNVEGLVRMLREELTEKTYLVVLDDVWNEDTQKWEYLRDSLQGIGGAKGSKIIVTTRSNIVVSTMQISPSLTHHIKKLSGEDSWTMFSKRAFANGGPKGTSTLVAIGKEMVEKCRGVPLAIKSLGGLMYSKKHEHEWLLIQENEIWKSPGDRTFKALRLSFDHLPSPSLKQCFAFCALFPKDFVIRKDNLIQLWMSQGYLQPPSESKLEMEDVGNNYFDILLLSSLFQDSKLDEYNNVISCKMHDLVHDLALQVSKGSCLTSEDGKLKDDSKVQHVLLLHFYKKLSLEISKQNAATLRTLLGIHLENIVDVKRVGASSIRALSSCFGHLPSSISKFIHLKYLDLSRTGFEILPDFVTKLYHLQTLKLSTNLQMLPENFHMLENLRHWYFDWENNWIRLPALQKMMPMMIGKLTSLRTLPFFFVGEEDGYKIEELRHLRNLRGELRIYNLGKVKSRGEAERVNLSGIDILNLHWGYKREEGINSNEDVLEGLKPHRILKYLSIVNFGGKRFAAWMMEDRLALENLVKIRLINCRKCEQIPALGHLPNLQVVQLVGLDVKRIGTEFYGDGVSKHDGDGTVGCSSNSNVAVFPALRELIVENMPNLEEWVDLSPAVRELTARDMPNLEEWSDVSCPNLKLLQIFNCPGLISIPSYFLSIQRSSLFVERRWWTGGKGREDPILAISFEEHSNIDAALGDLFQKVSKYVRKLSLNDHGMRYLPNKFQNLEELSNNFQNLEELSINRCDGLTCLPKGLPQTLVRLEIRDCPNLIMGNPDELRNLTSLQSLEIVRCPRLENCWNDRIVCLTSLRELDIGVFSEELEYFPWRSSAVSAATSSEVIDTNVQQCPFISLETLRLYGWRNVNSLPYQLQHRTALQFLSIREFNGLEVLPEWLGNLSSLQSLMIFDCSTLKELPPLEVMQRLANLRRLGIDLCDLLTKACTEGGPERHKISHSPLIELYDEV